MNKRRRKSKPKGVDKFHQNEGEPILRNIFWENSIGFTDIDSVVQIGEHYAKVEKKGGGNRTPEQIKARPFHQTHKENSDLKNKGQMKALAKHSKEEPIFDNNIICRYAIGGGSKSNPPRTLIGIHDTSNPTVPNLSLIHI